jgi:hypothetical protein
MIFDFMGAHQFLIPHYIDTPMIMSDFIFAVTTCYQHDKLFTRRQIQLVLILFQSHCIPLYPLLTLFLITRYFPQ